MNLHKGAINAVQLDLVIFLVSDETEVYVPECFLRDANPVRVPLRYLMPTATYSITIIVSFPQIPSSMSYSYTAVLLREELHVCVCVFTSTFCKENRHSKVSFAYDGIEYYRSHRFNFNVDESPDPPVVRCLDNCGNKLGSEIPLLVEVKLLCKHFSCDSKDLELARVSARTGGLCDVSERRPRV